MPKCWKCKEYGHTRDKCPLVLCSNCDEYGHVARDCTYSSSDEEECSRCGRTGHEAWDCDTECYRCHLIGHVASDCDTECYRCHLTGHVARDCDTVCHRCHRFGHVASNCRVERWPPTHHPRFVGPYASERRVQCRSCHQIGHITRDCHKNQQQPAAKANREAKQPNQRNQANQRNVFGGNCIPPKWRLSTRYSSISDAVTGSLQSKKKHELHEVTPQEHDEIQILLQTTWKHEVVGIGADARSSKHTGIQVVHVQRIENAEMFERYTEKKLKMFRRLDNRTHHSFWPVEKIKGSSGKVLTLDELMLDGVLRKNLSPKLNEHYLFHGTKEDLVPIIARDGMDNRFSSGSCLLGRGIYTAESPTKADHYTDEKNDCLKKMLLVRVLLGEPYINQEKNPPKFCRPPCKKCKELLCHCEHSDHFDSVIDDSGRLFREFVLYEQSQTYPEYVITYARVNPKEKSKAVSSKVKRPFLVEMPTCDDF